VSELVFMFPGQSSRYPAMLEKLAARPECADVVRRATSILGRDLAAHYRADNPAIYATNRDVQIGVFLANHLHLVMLEAHGLRARRSLGLSLGEYNHLVHIGALAFDEALPLIDARGRLYDEAEGGLMVSVFPTDAASIEGAIARLGLSGRVVVGLYNSPKQQVISGERAAVERLVAALEEESFIDAIAIEPRIPMHAPVFEPIGRRLAPVLERIAFSPCRGYVPNVRGAVLDIASPTVIRELLVAHTYQPVRWHASIEAVATSDCVFVEVGPRAVLFNLLAKSFRRARSDDEGDLAIHLRALTSELADAR
jgi:[acyl-carrier-protein] S-malonyltransferase